MRNIIVALLFPLAIANAASPTRLLGKRVAQSPPPSDGQVLKYNAVGEVWAASDDANTGGGSDALSIQGVSVSASSPNSGDVLTYNGTFWEPAAPTGGGSGFDTVGAFGGSPDAKGASSSGTTITIQPADATHPGAINLGTQQLGTGFKLAEDFVTRTLTTGETLAQASSNAGHGVPIFLGDSCCGPNTFWLGADFGNGSKGGMFGGYSGTTSVWDGVKNDFSAVSGIWLNPGGGMTKIGGGANQLTLVGNTLCTSLATDGSDIVTCTPSDERLKKNIVPYERGLEALRNVRTITYQLKSPSDMDAMHTGFSAQNLKENISEAVTENADGFYQVDFWPILAAQANAINELRARLEALEGPKLMSAKKTISQRKIPKLPKHEGIPFKAPKVKVH